MVPDGETCFHLLDRYAVPQNVIEHSRVVLRIAGVLCRELNRRGERMDPALVEAASLLHDIAKVSSFQTGENHSHAGARLLRELGFPEVAEIVRQHVVLDPEMNPGRITEAVVVHYADKRVKHDVVVSLGERFQDLKNRYGKSPEARVRLEALEGQSRSMEERIFRKIPLSPEDLSDPSVGNPPEGERSGALSATNSILPGGEVG
jgi:uncharacterized protein